MADQHIFFQKWVARLLPLYERPEAEELVYRLIDAHLDKNRLEFWDIGNEQIDYQAEHLTAKFESAITRLLAHEPVQYILGHTYFLDYKLKVGPGVLIPRPETEELVSLIIDREKDSRDLKILDIGTGSGCIPIALGGNLSCQQVIGIDVSEQALDIAKENAVNNSVQVDFILLDILKQSPEVNDLDILVSNPPYVLDSDKKHMSKNVLDHEPALALFVPDRDSLKFYKAIAKQGLNALKMGGRLYFEIHEDYGEAVKTMLSNMNYKDIELKKDIFLLKDRMILAKRG